MLLKSAPSGTVDLPGKKHPLIKMPVSYILHVEMSVLQKLPCRHRILNLTSSNMMQNLSLLLTHWKSPKRSVPGGFLGIITQKFPPKKGLIYGFPIRAPRWDRGASNEYLLRFWKPAESCGSFWIDLKWKPPNCPVKIGWWQTLTKKKMVKLLKPPTELKKWWKCPGGLPGYNHMP